MKLRTKIMMIVLLPILLLGIGIFLLAADRTANGIYDMAYNGMQATAVAVRDIFEVGNPGIYQIDENGDLWKGSSLNITEAVGIVDHIKNNTGMDITIFWGDTRILTSIENKAGERQIGTRASEQVIQKVLWEGENYLDRDIEILGKKYIVCYVPFYQEGTKEVVGMVVLGTPHEGVSKVINEIRIQMFLIITVVLIIVSILVIQLVSRIVSALEQSMEFLRKISKGNLKFEVDSGLLKRSDEIGLLGREIFELRRQLQVIVEMLQGKSHQLDLSSVELNTLSNHIVTVMQEMEQSAKDMAGSCSNQAEDANIASDGVTSMGEVIGSNHTEIKKMYHISDQIGKVSEQTMLELIALDRDMGMVKESINYLEQQTRQTKQSVDRIGSATEMIAAIASQTNLLSLNASIESARAGEQGRGFAVVASQIQKLSQQVNGAVKDIKDMVEHLIIDSDNTIQCMEEVHTVIQKQENSIQKTEQVFADVRDKIVESSNYMDIVMGKTEKLEEVRTDMVAAVQNSAAISEENAASIETVMGMIQNIYGELRTISNKTNDLGKLSTEMKESIHIFQI